MLSKAQFTEEVAKKLKEAREAKGLTQDELADKAGLYRTYIGHLENARYSPSAYVIYKIAQVLDLDSQKLLPF